LIEPKVDPAADEKLKKRAERFSVAKSWTSPSEKKIV
jgi:hypothetical protein